MNTRDVQLMISNLTLLRMNVNGNMVSARKEDQIGGQVCGANVITIEYGGGLLFRVGSH